MTLLDSNLFYLKKKMISPTVQQLEGEVCVRLVGCQDEWRQGRKRLSSGSRIN
jgi:hypothetical protein